MRYNGLVPSYEILKIHNPMKSSVHRMDKTGLTLRVCGWSSIAMGLVFFLIPDWYAELEGANTENIAWLRNLGAALVAVNGVGALLAAKDPIGERNLYDVVMLASILETMALGWSTYTWEFSATEEIFITGPLILAAVVSLALILLRPSAHVSSQS